MILKKPTHAMSPLAHCPPPALRNFAIMHLRIIARIHQPTLLIKAMLHQCDNAAYNATQRKPRCDNAASTPRQRHVNATSTPHQRRFNVSITP